MKYLLIQEVRQVRAERGATVRQKARGLDVQYTARDPAGNPLTFAAMIEKGHLICMLNGLRFTLPNLPRGDPFDGQFAEFIVSPTGRVLEVLPSSLNNVLTDYLTGPAFAQMFGIGTLGSGMLVFPSSPVPASHQWQYQTAGEIPSLFQGNPGDQTSGVSYQVAHQLTKQLQKHGRRLFVVVNEVKASTPGVGPRAAPETTTEAGGSAVQPFTQAVKGTSSFDPAKGEFWGGTYKAELGFWLHSTLPIVSQGVLRGAPRGYVKGTFEVVVQRELDPPAPGSSRPHRPTRPRARPRQR